ncbi:MAG: type II toxin-antitoxin system RelE/ParE family toxin [Pseudomonadota bacterium]
MESKFEVITFKTNRSKEPFNDWLYGLDQETKNKVFNRISRIKNGNFGDYKNLGFGIFELRFDFGSGYRIYFGKKDHKIIILLCGGNKKTQNKDIEKAKKYWEEYENQE